MTVVAGCFRPSPQPGAPCPDGLCPDPLVCSQQTQTCERAASDLTDAPINTTCDALTDPQYGSVSLTNGGNFPSTATYACLSGFDLAGVAEQTCAADGSWSASPPTCDWTGPRAFTACGQTGPTGPSDTQCATAYTATTLAGEVTVIDGIQQWTVPATGTYRIVVAGAAGSSSGGFGGARMEGDFALTQGSTLKILVGQLPTGSLAGGGGSFVTDAANAPLIIAGGGGSGICAACVAAESGGRIQTTGGTMTGVGRADDGAGGLSGNAVSGAGGGLLTDGALGGKAFVNGGIGATGVTGFIGGFGGGGARNGGNGAGAGGGYSGGSANSNGTDTTLRFGGGGGSFNSGTSPVAVPNANLAVGSITIDLP